MAPKRRRRRRKSNKSRQREKAFKAESSPKIETPKRTYEPYDDIWVEDYYGLNYLSDPYATYINMYPIGSSREVDKIAKEIFGSTPYCMKDRINNEAN